MNNVTTYLMLFLLLATSSLAVETQLRVYKDSAFSLPVEIVGSNTPLYLEAYNGVSCCQTVQATVGSKIVELNDIGAGYDKTANDGIFRGGFDGGVNEESSSTLPISVRFTAIAGTSLTIPLDKIAPSAPTLVDKSGLFSFTLEWNIPAADIDHYVIYESQGSIADTKFAQKQSTTQTSYSRDKPNDGTKLYFRVHAVDKAQNSGPLSNEIILAPKDAIPPDKITNISIKQQKNSVILDWPKSNDSSIEKYAIFKSRIPFLPTLGITPQYTSASTFMDNDVKDGETYYYRVRALDAANEGPLSDQLQITLNLGIPSRPKISYLLKDESVVLSWDALTNSKHYQLYSSSQSLFGLDNPITVEQTTYSIQVKSTQYFAVRGVSEAGLEGPLSEIVRIDPAKEKAPQIVELKAHPTPQKTIALEWKTDKEAAYFTLFRSASPSFDQGKPLATSSEPLFSDLDVDHGTTYYYAVSATDFRGSVGPLSTSASARARDEIMNLTVLYPSAYVEVSQSFILLTGIVETQSRLEVLSNNKEINDQQIILDNRGIFLITLPLTEGENTVVITGTDQYGNTKQERLRIYNKQKDNTGAAKEAQTLAEQIRNESNVKGKIDRLKISPQTQKNINRKDPQSSSVLTAYGIAAPAGRVSSWTIIFITLGLVVVACLAFLVRHIKIV